jgi:ubiquinone biosynthesis protein UbiJ
VTISGPPFTLLRLLGSLDSVDGVLPPDVSVSGELQLVQKLTGLAKRANIDWEEPLSKLFGDSVAHEVGRGVRGLVSWARVASETFSSDLGEYLREERRLTPTQLEVDDFTAHVDRVRDDVERLELRIARLDRRAREH